MDRHGRKRPEPDNPLPAADDKRPCTSSAPAPMDSAASAATSSSSSSDRTANGYEPDNPLPAADDKRPCTSSAPAPMDSAASAATSSSSSSDRTANGYDSDNSDIHLNPTRSTKILSSLTAADDPGAHLAALTELCEILSFCTEDSAACFSLEALIPILLGFARGEGGSAEVILLATRAVTYLCDVMPSSAEGLVRHGAVEVLCGRLLAIEYLDVAEQCLQALEKISKTQGVACLKGGTIVAVLGYIDFFSSSVQRVAVSTVANVCKKLPLDCSKMVMESVPALCNLLDYEERKLVEMVVTCLIRITDCFSCSTDLLDELCTHGLIKKLLHLVAIDGRMSLSQTVHVGLIGILTKLASKSLLAFRTLFELNISSILKGILMISDLSHGTAYSPLRDQQSNQVHDVLKLLNQLIPSAVNDEDIQLVSEKEKILNDKPEFLHQFSADILPVSIQVVNSGTNLPVCYGCVSIINNIVYFCTPDMLHDLLKDMHISSFLAGLLARKDKHVLFPTLKIVEILLQKLPGAFSSSFRKEGVIYAIDSLLLYNNSILDSNSHSLAQQPSNSENQVTSRNVSRCLCYAFSSCHSTAETKACRFGKDVVLNLAEHIKSTYLSNAMVDYEMGMTETLQKLKSYCKTLNDNGDTCMTNDFAEKEDYLSDILGQVLHELSNGDSMSTFEFIESGLVKSLAHYLSNGRYLQGTPGNHYSSNHSLAVLTRFQTFAAISLSNPGPNWQDMLLTSLVRKLLSALSSLDNFPIITSYHVSKQRAVFVDVPVRHSSIHPCLKVCFMREEGEESLCDYSEVVTLELSTSVDVIEEYLRPKVYRIKNECEVEQAEKVSKPIDMGSKGKGAEGLVHQEVDGKFIQASVSMLPEVLNSQERHTLLVDTSAKLSELMTDEKSSERSSSGGERVDDKVSSLNNEDEYPKLIFSLEGKELKPSMTLYQAILQSRVDLEPDLIVGPRFWSDVHKVTYKRAKSNATQSEGSLDTSESSLFWDRIGFSWPKLSFFSSLLLARLPCNLERSNPAYDVLFLVKVIEGLNRTSFQLLSNDKNIAFAQGRIENVEDLKVVVSTVPQSEFMSSKLTDKLEQQMRDSLVLTTGSMPLWCTELMTACPFLFSFETRWKYFQLTIPGSSKTQYSNNGISSVSDRRPHPGLSLRQKFKVDRSNILESAKKMMASFARSKAVIEVEYNEEVGTGLGPTMEFYTLVSHEFQKIGMGMWREDRAFVSTGGSGFVVAPFGLFPRPLSEQTKLSDVIGKFVLLGKIVAKAFKDGRILDMPFSSAFYKLLLEQELGIYDIQSFDPELGRTLLEFQALVNRKRFLESTSRGNLRCSFDLSFRNTLIEDLCLDFTLPGYSDYALTCGSNSKLVNADNLEEYVRLVVNATIRDGISKQVEAFKSGFDEVFPLKSLQIFTDDEFDRLLCGERDTWDFGQLLDHIKFDHGYTASSTSSINLLQIIQEFGCKERRAFLQFVTGAPRLPPGGLASLNPKLTIVRKHCSNNPDMDLPSVMTCTNYLKLPSYSSKERMKQRLLLAITEGQGSFHLS